MDTGESRLHLFDSEAPGSVLDSFQIAPPLPNAFSVEFDQGTGELYAFEHYECAIATCPGPSFDVARIDPFTGSSTILDTPSLYPFRDIETDINPVSREIRYLKGSANVRIPLSTFELHMDADLNNSAHAFAVAHAPAVEGRGGIETFAIGSIASQGGSWHKLLRVGGPGGVPPASSGEVTIIGNVDVVGFVRGFDVSASGKAYIATMWDYDDPDGFHIDNRLYTIDLATAAVEEVGFIAMPQPYSFVNGLSVAPPGLGGGVMAVPALSTVGLAALTILLAAAALWRLRLFPS